MDFKNNPIRTLARSTKWQTLYARAKEMNIQLFENVTDYSAIQIEFLYWLELYHSLYMDLGMNEPYISENVIKDDIRVDAYVLWRSKVKFSKEKQADNKKPKVDVSIGHGSVVFK